MSASAQHTAPPALILASASPRRSQLLGQVGVPHRIVPADLDERGRPGESAEQRVIRLAEQKALHVQAALRATARPNDAVALPVLAADTLVVLDGTVLGKPAGRDEALAMLARLSGRTHQVLSSVALAAAAGVRSTLSRSEVRMRPIAPAEREAYWASGEPCDKAGAYAIQGLGAIFIAELHGSYSGVVGLPLFETVALLRAAGIAVLPDVRIPGSG